MDAVQLVWPAVVNTNLYILEFRYHSQFTHQYTVMFYSEDGSFIEIQKKYAKNARKVND